MKLILFPGNRARKTLGTELITFNVYIYRVVGEKGKGNYPKIMHAKSFSFVSNPLDFPPINFIMVLQVIDTERE